MAFLWSWERSWSYVCPRSPYWTESECTSPNEVYEHNVESLAREVIGQNWSGEMVSLFLTLETVACFFLIHDASDLKHRKIKTAPIIPSGKSISSHESPPEHQNARASRQNRGGPSQQRLFAKVISGLVVSLSSLPLCRSPASACYRSVLHFTLCLRVLGGPMLVACAE